MQVTGYVRVLKLSLCLQNCFVYLLTYLLTTIFSPILCNTFLVIFSLYTFFLLFSVLFLFLFFLFLYFRPFFICLQFLFSSVFPLCSLFFFSATNVGIITLKWQPKIFRFRRSVTFTRRIHTICLQIVPNLTFWHWSFTFKF